MKIGWKKLLLLSHILVVFCHASSTGQRLKLDTSYPAAFANVVAVYNTSFAPQLHLFNGKEYADYTRPFTEGQPYFVTNQWSKGTVSYDGDFYEDVSLLYNLVTDEVIILNYQSTSKIQLLKEKVSGFSDAGHFFTNLTSDSLNVSEIKPGFYDVLTRGKATLLARRTKNIQSFTKQSIETKVFENVHFYLKKDNVYYSVHNKNSFLAHLSDKKKEIQTFMKQNDLSYRHDPETVMVKAAEYYNQITR